MEQARQSWWVHLFIAEIQVIVNSSFNISNVQANMLRLDPAKIAGPLETAFQDIVGQSFLLGVSYAIFSVTEHRI